MRDNTGRWPAAGIMAAVTVLIVAISMMAPTVAEALTRSTEPIATICAAETYTWFGQHPLAPGESFVAVTVAAVEPGSQLLITGMDASPSTLSILVGDTPAASGSSIAGGEVTATNGGTEALVVGSVALNVDRCHQVAVEPIGAAVGAASFGRDLPETGSASVPVAIMAFGSTAAGLVLLKLSRRRQSGAADRS